MSATTLRTPIDQREGVREYPIGELAEELADALEAYAWSELLDLNNQAKRSREDFCRDAEALGFDREWLQEKWPQLSGATQSKDVRSEEAGIQAAEQALY